MRQRLLSSTLIIAVFVASAWGAFATTRAVTSEASSQAEAPQPTAGPDQELDEVLVALTAVDGDPWEEAVRLSDADYEARVAASEQGIVLADAVALGTFDHAAIDADGSGTDASSGSGGDRTIIDPCATDAPADDCPEGIGGTVLALRAFPPLVTAIAPWPVTPDAALGAHIPACEPVELEIGQVPLGIVTNRPVDMEINRVFWEGDGVWGEDGLETVAVTHTTYSDAAAQWYDWLDEEMPTDDPRQWIRDCIILEDVEPGEYLLRASSVAIGSPTADHFTRAVLSVPGDAWDDVERHRRPTGVFPVGPDRIDINATHTPDATLVAHALLGDASCDTGGDPGIFASPLDHGRVPGALLASNPIPASTLEGPLYRNLPEHSQSTTVTVELLESTPHTICVYWLADDDFGGLRIYEAESIAVSPPQAWRPTVTLLGVANLVNGVESYAVAGAHPACGTGSTVEVAQDGPRTQYLDDEPLVCAVTSGLTDVTLRGLTVELAVAMSDNPGAAHRSRARLAIDVTCVSTECVPPDPHVAIVPLPRVPVSDGDCGSGFGSG